MTHRVEPATPDDEPDLIALWNRCLGASHPMTERAWRERLGLARRVTHADLLVIRQGGRPAGFALTRAFRDPGAPGARDAVAVARMLAPLRDTAALGALCVDPAERGRGIGSALLEAVEAIARAHGARSLWTALGPAHFVPGVPAEAPELDRFLEKRGWERQASCVDLHGDVSGYRPDPAIAERLAQENPHVHIRVLREGEEARLRALLEEFPAVWQVLLDQHLADGPLEDVVVAAEGEELLGFCHVHDARSPRLAGSTLWYTLLGDAPGGLGPIGVAPAHRRRGLGLALLSAALEHQRRRGVRCVVIDWTTLVEFYGRVGFRPWRHYTPRKRSLSLEMS